MEKRALIRMKSMVSFAGQIVNEVKIDDKIDKYVIKPSDKSNVLIHIPVEEIDRLFFMNGNIKKGDELDE